MGKSNFNHIAIDLELEQPKTNKQTPDSLLDNERIIQVGWVVFKINPFIVLKKQSMFVDIGVPLSSFIKNLTGISDHDISSGGTLEDIYKILNSDVKEYGTLRVLKQWGGGDQECLRKELPEVDWVFGRSAMNVKHIYQMYAEACDMNRSGGLKKSMKRCGLDFEGSAHDAMIDALNTAKMYDFFVRKIGENK